jgi:glycosyltransferase involved in cell wall biosynthesis
LKILLELRPALDGHAGIPQETRLLFRELAQLEGVEVEGLIQSSNRLLPRGLPAPSPSGWPESRKIDRLSRVVVALNPDSRTHRIVRAAALLRMALKMLQMVCGTALGRRTSLSHFDASKFKDFVWRALFEKTLRNDDFEAVTQARYRVLQLPWSALHAAAALTRRFGLAVYPRLNTTGLDVLVAETPYPGRVSGRTRLVVRYHDAIPLLMPHTISDKARHRTAHYEALRRNVADGAWFACVSDATRHDLLSIFPEVAARALTIHNVISDHYFPEASTNARVPDIVNTRRSRSGKGSGRRLDAGAGAPDYLLMVSTIEPRKNHLTLLAAWEQLRAKQMPDLQLVFVGAPGWDHKAIVRKCQPWLDRGGLHLLKDVPAAELRLLYRHARATVCPSYGEGFDFSGVEAMRCGGVVAASDIAVHRDIFADAAEYFSPYSATDLAQALLRLLEPGATARRSELVERGAQVSARYRPEVVMPQWQAFFDALKT